MEGINIHEYPSLAAFLRLRRMATQYSVRKASIAAGFPSSTWGSLENSRMPKPSFENLHDIARVLKIRPWPLALIAGTKPRGKMLGEYILEKLPVPHWWDQRGGNFLRLVREANDRTIEDVTKKWQVDWPAIPELSDPNAWEELERSGQLPPLPRAPIKSRQPTPGGSIQILSGGWWWSLLTAASGDSESAIYLLPGLVVILGKTGSKVASLMDDLRSFERLVDVAYKDPLSTRETFNDAKYFSVALEVARDMKEHAVSETQGQRLRRIEQSWGLLSYEQQDRIVALVEDLTKGNLPTAQD